MFELGSTPGTVTDDSLLLDTSRPTLAKRTLDERVVVDFEEFESSKENIIPLKGGRKATDLRRIFGKTITPLQEIKPLQPISCGTPSTPVGGGTPSFKSPQSSMNPFMMEDESLMEESSPATALLKPFFCFNIKQPTKICFDNHNMKPKLSTERKQFEKRIKSLSNHLDPITVWLEYIEWIERSYPTLGKASQYVNVLQSCTKYILSENQLLERYRNDQRYLGVWLKYADQCMDPVDVFTFLETKNICLNHSELYIRWATLLEDRKDLKAADAVLDKGAHRGAQPVKALQTFHTGVKARFMKSILNRTNNPSTQPPPQPVSSNASENESVLQRSALNPLPKKPTVFRATLSKPPTSLKPMKMKANNQSLTQKNSPLNNFVIYDESVNNGEKIAHASSTRTLPFQIQREIPIQAPNYLPSEQEQEKENSEHPDKWTNYTNPQHQDSQFLPTLNMLSTAPSKPQVAFSIFVDEEFK